MSDSGSEFRGSGLRVSIFGAQLSLDRVLGLVLGVGSGVLKGRAACFQLGT